jgi:hypothetical protein
VAEFGLAGLVLGGAGAAALLEWLFGEKETEAPPSATPGE